MSARCTYNEWVEKVSQFACDQNTSVSCCWSRWKHLVVPGNQYGDYDTCILNRPTEVWANSGTAVISYIFLDNI